MQKFEEPTLTLCYMEATKSKVLCFCLVVCESREPLEKDSKVFFPLE